MESGDADWCLHSNTATEVGMSTSELVSEKHLIVVHVLDVVSVSSRLGDATLVQAGTYLCR